jgi:hypothetical protein
MNDSLSAEMFAGVLRACFILQVRFSVGVAVTFATRLHSAEDLMLLGFMVTMLSLYCKLGSVRTSR